MAMARGWAGSAFLEADRVDEALLWKALQNGAIIFKGA